MGPSLMIVEEHKVTGSHLIPPLNGQMGPWEGRAAPAQYKGASLLCVPSPGSFLATSLAVCRLQASRLASGSPEPCDGAEMAAALTLLMSQEQEARSLHK